MEDKELLEEELQVSTEEENEFDQRLYQIDIRVQELEILIDQIEEKVMEENNEELYTEEYWEYKSEYKQLIKERKVILKEINSKDSSTLNKVSIWVIVYGIIMVILSFPVITSTLWLDFANVLLDLLSGAFSGLSSDDFLYYIVVFLIIFALPLLINVITWTLYNNFVNSKADKKVYIGFWIVQGIMSLGMIIYMSIQLYGA